MSKSKKSNKSTKSVAPFRNINDEVRAAVVQLLNDQFRMMNGDLRNGAFVSLYSHDCDPAFVDMSVRFGKDGIDMTIRISNDEYDLGESALPFSVTINPSIRLGDLTAATAASYGVSFTLAAEIAAAISSRLASLK